MHQQDFKQISKNQFSELRKLSSKKGRIGQGLFITEGRKVLAEFLEAGWELKHLLVTKAAFPQVQELIRRFEEQAVWISEEDMKRLSNLSTPPGILAVFRMREWRETDLTGNLLVLDGLSDPGNLGGMIRCAEWFGVGGVICTTDCVELFNPKVVQASMGSLARMKVVYMQADEVLTLIHRASMLLVGSAADGEDVAQFKPAKRWALVIGSESHGIRNPILGLLDKTIAIPRRSNHTIYPESLNALSACAVLLDRLSIRP